MNEYNVLQDIVIIKELLGFIKEGLANALEISRITLNNWMTGKNNISEQNMSASYSFAFKSGIRLSKIKEQLYKEDASEKSHILLFHGAKSKLEGELSINKSRKNNDFGQGFYCGESLEQSAMFVSTFPESSLYMLDFDKKGLKERRFGVNRDWMLTIAYFRNRLGEFRILRLLKV